MRKVLTLLLALVMAFALSACGGKDESSSNKNDNATINRTTIQAGTTDGTNDPVGQPSASPTVDHDGSPDVRIKLIFDNEEYIVKMYDNPTSQDFLSTLPLTLTFKEYGGFGKLSILDKGLITEDAPSGSDPEVGDIGYYAPWKDVNMYYTDWNYSSGLIKLGRIESGLEEFTKKLKAMHDDFTVNIQKMN
ncbi:cyclophilin-like fold protein [Candidatus Pristimantibacillus sp. PTI5]|uniref:cyclophilin-like fold protein n=1 Tax=Candidatus Pristimantibacillus sp. PTI5 TaxID=3400422 RepID=UPI003B019027